MSALSIARLLGPYLICLIAGFGAAWQVQAWRYGAQIEHINAVAADDLAEARKLALHQTVSWQARIAAIDETKTKELIDARSEIQMLRADVATGRRQLQFAARPAAGSVSGTAAAGSMDTRAGAELTADAEQAYFTLREGLARLEAKLAACQDTLRQLTSRAVTE